MIAMYILRCYQSELLESHPQFFGLYLKQNLVIRNLSSYWVDLRSQSFCLWFLFAIALKLIKTKPGAKQLGSLVNAIRHDQNDLLGFTEEEKKLINESDGNFAVVAGVRR